MPTSLAKDDKFGSCPVEAAAAIMNFVNFTVSPISDSSRTSRGTTLLSADLIFNIIIAEK